MKNWEYLPISSETPLISEQLNLHGSEGWELVSVVKATEYMYVFKKRLV
jgi:hypothetical protein